MRELLTGLFTGLAIACVSMVWLFLGGASFSQPPGLKKIILLFGPPLAAIAFGILAYVTGCAR